MHTPNYLAISMLNIATDFFYLNLLRMPLSKNMCQNKFQLCNLASVPSLFVLVTQLAGFSLVVYPLIL